MAYNEAELIAIADQLATAYRRGEVEILDALVNAHLSDWERARAMQQQARIETILAELGQTETDWSQTHLRRLYQEGINDADKALDRIRALAPPEEFSAMHEASIELYDQTLARALTEARATGGRRVDDVFRRAGLAALQQETIVGGTARDAVKRMVQDLERQGVTAFVAQRADGGTMEFKLGDYADIVARTTSREATDAALFNRLAEREHDLVKITRHEGECPKCLSAIAQYGVIYSLSGKSEKYPALDDARAAGMFHPRCVHRPVPYVAGYSAAA